MSKDLKPGDVCRIVAPPPPFVTQHPSCIGKVVVLIEDTSALAHDRMRALYPIWMVTGKIYVSHICLEKIHPDSQFTVEEEEESVPTT